MYLKNREYNRQGKHRAACFWFLLVSSLLIMLLVSPLSVYGKDMIGELQGPEIITDPALFPMKFNEAPMLAELVKEKKLPSVKERIPKTPLVIKPLGEIGQYGGILYRGFTGPGDVWNGKRFAAHDHILYFNYEMSEVVPNVAKSWEVTDGGRTITIQLREGMKWSDGVPFTANDFMFWYEEMYLNRDLNPGGVGAVLMSGGLPGTVEKVNDYTIRYTFSAPYYLFPEILAGFTVISSHGTWGFSPGMGGFAPAHYLKQFHPKYAAEDELAKKVKAGGFNDWTGLITTKNSWGINTELPAITPWIPKTSANETTWVLERNPYFYAVDTEGNQLPYIDKVVMILSENLELLNARALAGEYDFQARHIDIRKLPLFLANQEKGDYKVYLDAADNGGNVYIDINMTYEDPKIRKWFNNRTFRRALSLGIDRDQINESFFLGLGTPGSVVPAENNEYSPGSEYRKLWSTYDPDEANRMLDSIGLDKKDAQGYRLRTDEKKRLYFQMETVTGAFSPYAEIGEMIREHWKRIGIDVLIKPVERSLWGTRVLANEVQMCLWDNGGTERLFSPGVADKVFGSRSGPLYDQWLVYNEWFKDYDLWLGKEGKAAEPPEPGIEPAVKYRKVISLWQQASGMPLEDRIKAGKQIWKMQAEEVWRIGLVGLAPATMGVRIGKNGLGNVPERQIFSLDGMTPGLSRPETFYWKE